MQNSYLGAPAASIIGGPSFPVLATTFVQRYLIQHRTQSSKLQELMLVEAQLAEWTGDNAVFEWLKPNKQRAAIREDRRHLEARARRFLKGYLSADAPRKQRYYEVIAGAVAACEPGVSDPDLNDAQRTELIANTALAVVKKREADTSAERDQLAAFITDAYATVAVASRRASAAYRTDGEMQQLGTAAVHLVTIATSFMSRGD
jgi:hypothetical protein